MRELTDAEYRVLLSILSLPSETEQARIRGSGLPSSTYNVAKRRIYEQGWATDRWVPQPAALGFWGVELALWRPFAADRATLESRLTADRRCVLLWSGMHGLLSVRFLPEAPGRSTTALPADPQGTIRLRLACRASGSLPAYFDYSGLWARFGGERAPAGYPRGLDLTAPEIPPADRRAVQKAIGTGSEQGPGDLSLRWTNLLRLPRSQRRVVEHGSLAGRTLLHLSALPPIGGRRIGEVIFLVGKNRPRDPLSLLNALTKDCAVFPFLFSTVEGLTLVAGVGQTSARDPGRVPVRSARRSVMGVVNEHLDHVEVLIEPVESLRELVAHRYQGLPIGPVEGGLSSGGASSSEPLAES